MLAAVGGGERQVVGGAVASGAHQRPLVVDQRQALGRRQLGRRVRGDGAQHLRRIRRAVIALRAGVGKHPRRTRGAGHRHRLRHVAEDFARRRLLTARLHADRHLPAQVVSTGLIRSEQEALLLERQRRAIPGAGGRDLDQREPGLIDETRQDALDRLAGRRRQRFGEIFRGRVAVGVRLHVGVDAFAERLGADVALDHPHHRGALLIGDRVEQFFDLRRRLRVDVNRPRRVQRIDVERLLVLERFVDRYEPVGMRRRERLVRHPRREAFVQPQVVPPLHRDEIAEPLMRHLVREHRRDGFARGDRRRLRIREQIGFPIEDRRSVLHRAGRKVRHRDDVELSERVLDGVVGVVKGQDLLCGVERDAGQILLVGRRADPDRNAFGRALLALEVADRHRHEIRRHLRRRRKLHRVLRDRRSGDVGQHLAVRDHGVAAIDRRRQRERRLEGRLVEAGERAAGVGRLELRHGVLPRLRLADVEALQLIVQDAAVADMKLGGALRQRRRDGERRRLCLFVERDDGRLRRGAGADGDLAKLDLEGVQHDARGRRGHLHANGLSPLEPFVGQVHDEREVVVFGSDGRRQPLGRGGEGRQQERREHEGDWQPHKLKFTRNLTPPGGAG